MIYEFQIDTIRPGRIGQYIEAFKTKLMPIRTDRFGKVYGFWKSEFGTLGQAYQIWKFQSVSEWQEKTHELKAVKEWHKESQISRLPFLVSTHSQLFEPVDWCPPRESSADGIYELRFYYALPSRQTELLENMKQGLQARCKYSEPSAFWSSLTGELDTIAHLWIYRDLCERANLRRLSLQDSEWSQVVSRNAEMMKGAQSIILDPVRLGLR